MVKIYGRPFNPEERKIRWLRRGTAGLVAGGSEAAAEVEIAGEGGGRLAKGGGRGRPGPPGFRGQDGRSHGWKGYAMPGGAGIDTFGFRWQNPSTLTKPGSVLATNDIDGLIRVVRPTAAGANSVTSIRTLAPTGTGDADLFQVGQGNGRGGFILVTRFAFSALPATRRWFVGVAAGGSAWTGDPSTHVNLIGVGQDSGDTSPQFLRNDGAGTATKSSSGLATVAINTIYELRILCDPLLTDAVLSLRRYVGGVSSGFASTTASTNLPAVMTSGFFYANNGSAGGVMGIVFLTFYAEIQPVIPLVTA